MTGSYVAGGCDVMAEATPTFDRY